MLKPDSTCLACSHHRFDLVTDKVLCLHPQRPPDKAQVVAWFKGCPQHEPIKKETQ